MSHDDAASSQTPAPIFCVRTSSHGDIIMLGSALARLRSAGLEPVLVTHPPFVSTAKCLGALQWILATEGRHSELWHRPSVKEPWSPATDGPWQHATAVLDFQVTARSRRALRGLKTTLASQPLFWLSSRKDRWRRLATMTRARLCGQKVTRKAETTQTTHLPLWQATARDHDVLESYDDLVTRALRRLGIVEHKGQELDPTAPLIAPLMAPPFSHSTDAAEQPCYDCVIFAGASLPLKAWPKAHVIACAQELTKAGLSVALAGGPAERQESEQIAAQCPGVVSLAGQLPMDQTVALIAKARFVVTTDSFPAHVRDLSGGPGLVLFGATSPTLGFAPRSKQMAVASVALCCSPCTRHGRGTCRFGNHACMMGLTGHAVAAYVLKALQP
jgi:ADP-heptose:LPS heptosyltransferase